MDSSRQALVTGGARGIGFAIAQALLRDSYAVTVTGLDAAETAAMPASQGLTATVLDVTDNDAVKTAVGRFSRLDVLVNAAGTILRDGAEFTADGFAKVVDVNLTGTMRMCLAARQLLEKEQGAIVNIASLWSFFGAGMNPAYGASKGGVVQLTKALAVAWAPKIRVNAVAPGWIDTALTGPARADTVRSDAIVERTPQGRWGAPADIGGATAFLCSDAARFITGTVLTIDGGYSAK